MCTAKENETLEHRLSRLQGIMAQVADTGLDGQMLAQRIEGDLHRLMNTAWLNCSDLIHRHERHTQAAMPVAAKAAMEFAATADEGQAFLKLWLEGDFEALRQEWPEAPELIYVNRDLVI